MITSSNLTQYINFLHNKRKGTPASQELLNHWSQISPNDISKELQNLYDFWHLSPQDIFTYETEFLNTLSPNKVSNFQDNRPSSNSPMDFYPQSSHSTEPSLKNYQSAPVSNSVPNYSQYSTQKKRNAWPVIIIVLLVLIAVPAAGYFIYNKLSESSNSTSTSNNFTKTKPKETPQKVEVQQQKIETEEPIDEADNQYKIDMINGLLSAEENRDFSRIQTYFAPKMERYWAAKNPSRDKLLELYQETWAKAINIKYDNISVKRISNNVYEMSANYSYYSIKDDSVKSVKVKNMYEFNKEGFITKAYGK